MFEHEAAGDYDAAIAAAAEAAAIGERFGDADLFALAAQDAGHPADRARAASRRACALLDEAMVAVTAGELSPIVNGLRLLRRDRRAARRRTSCAARRSGRPR